MTIDIAPGVRDVLKTAADAGMVNDAYINRYRTEITYCLDNGWIVTERKVTRTLSHMRFHLTDQGMTECDKRGIIYPYKETATPALAEPASQTTAEPKYLCPAEEAW